MQKDVCVGGFGGAESLMAMSYMASKEWGWGSPPLPTMRCHQWNGVVPVQKPDSFP